MKKRSCLSAVCMIVVLSVLFLGWGAPPAQAGGATLSLNKTTYVSGEEMTVTFSPSTGLGNSAWIGTVPSSVPHGSGDVADEHDITYFWVTSFPSGVGKLDAPKEVGSYDVRFFSTDPGGVELASFSITVVPGPTTGGLTIDNSVYPPNGTINVTYSPTAIARTAWVGIIPSDIAHNDYNLANNNYKDYWYVNKYPDGTGQLKAPDKAGSYDVRLFSQHPDGKELASLSFTVGSGTGTGPVSSGTLAGSSSSGTTTGPVIGPVIGPVVIPGHLTGGLVIPGTPTGNIVLTATPGDKQVKLSWTVPSTLTGVAGYHLYRGTTAGGESTSPVTDFVITGTTHTDMNVVNGTTYYYIVKPVYSGNTLGGSSNEVSATPPGSGNSSTTGTNTIILQIGNPNVQVNGVTQVVDTPATIVSGRTMVPLRFVAESMGGTVNWDGAGTWNGTWNNPNITLNVRNTVILLWIDRNETMVNGVEGYTDVPPQVINSRTMVPLRFILENLNCQVNWESSTQTVTITY